MSKGIQVQFDTLDKFLLCGMMFLLFAVQSYYVYAHPKFSFVLAIFSLSIAGLSFMGSYLYPDIRFIYRLSLSLALVSNSYFLYHWVNNLWATHTDVMATLVTMSHEPWQFLMLAVCLLCAINLVTSISFNVLPKREVLPFQKTLRLSRDQSLGSASLLYGTGLQEMTTQTGILLGQREVVTDPKKSPLLRVHLEGNGLTIAPPRSGKFTSTLSALMACVTEYDNNYPLVSIEPKGQAYCVWAKRRRQLGRRVVLLDPFKVISTLGEEGNKTLQARGKDPEFNHLLTAHSDCFNPLDFITHDSTMVQKIDAMLEALIPHFPNANPTELHFNKAARRILAGFISWVCIKEPPETRNLCRVYDLINQPEAVLFELLGVMAESTEGYGLPRDTANLMLNVNADERGSFFSTTTNAIDYLKYPEMRAHLSHSNFDLNELAQNKLDIFVVVPQHLIESLKTWIRLWVTLPIHLISEKRPTKRILMAIDELKALGYIKPLSDAYNLTSGYGLSIWGCTQAHSDLEAVYGEKGAKSMITCSQVVQFFNISPADLATQNYVSSIIGDTTVLTRGTSDGNSSSMGWRNSQQSKSKNNSLQETKQRLIPPDEVPHLPEKSQLLFIRHHKALSKPIFCYKALYYERPEFAGLYDPDPYQLLEQENVC